MHGSTSHHLFFFYFTIIVLNLQKVISTSARTCCVGTLLAIATTGRKAYQSGRMANSFDSEAGYQPAWPVIDPRQTADPIISHSLLQRTAWLRCLYRYPFGQNRCRCHWLAPPLQLPLQRLTGNPLRTDMRICCNIINRRERWRHSPSHLISPL